jgi:hypothetical protein
MAPLSRCRAALVVTLVALGLTACGGGDDSATPTETTETTEVGSTTTTAVPDEAIDLASIPVRPEDIGDIFQAQPPDGNDDGLACDGQELADEVPPIEEVDGDVLAPGPSGPVVTSQAARYEDAEVVAGVFDALASTLAACDGVLESGDLSLALEPVDRDQVGDHSVAYRGTATQGGLPVIYSAIFVQVDDLLLTFVQAAIGGMEPDEGITEAGLAAMVDRASA